MKRFVFYLCLFFYVSSCSGQNKSAATNKKTDFDSLLTTYKTEPVYYVDYGNTDCMFELRVNDIVVDQLTRPGRIGGTSATINPYILKSGKQKVSLKLYPNPGQTMIKSSTNNRYPYFKPFEMNINYIDFKLSDDQQSLVDVYTMPDIVTPKEGIPYYEFEAEFEAKVPYEITTYDDCIDLRKVPDIEKRVVAEFERVRQLMIDHKFEELRELLAYKNYDIGIPLYQSSEKQEVLWEDYINSIRKTEIEDWQPIDDYKLVFYADGRLVTLESKKESGFPSALLWIKYGEETYQYCNFEIRLGIRKGTDELIPIR